MRSQRLWPRLAMITCWLLMVEEPAGSRASSPQAMLRVTAPAVAEPLPAVSGQTGSRGGSMGLPGRVAAAEAGEGKPAEPAAPPEAGSPGSSPPPGTESTATSSPPSSGQAVSVPSSAAPTGEGTAVPAPAAPVDESPGGAAPPAAAPSPKETKPAASAEARPAATPPVKPPPHNGPRVEWSYLGLSVQPARPRLMTLISARENLVAAGYEMRTGEITAPTVLYDGRTGLVSRRIFESEPLSMVDTRGNLAALTVRGDQVQLIVHQLEANGGRSGGTRILRLPQPQGASAAQPYLTSPAHFAPDGALILLGSGRDRLYRVNLALGEVKVVLPEQPLEIVDFDVSADGEVVVLDAFEQQIVWLDTTGGLKASTLLTRNEGAEPTFYYLSVAAAPGRAAWVGVAVRQEGGGFTPEVQRVQGKMRERQRLDRGQGSLGFPLELAADGEGGVYAADENNWIYHVSSSSQLLRAWEARPDGLTTVEPERQDQALYLAASGAELPNFGRVFETALPAIHSCYDRLRKINAKAGGSFRVQLSTHDRNIQRVEVYQKDFEDFGLESCISQALRDVRFPSRVGQQTMRIQLKFIPPGRS